MTAKEIKTILVDALKGGWVVLEDSTATNQYIKDLKQATTGQEIADIIAQLETETLLQGVEVLEDMTDELNAILD